MKKIGFLVLLFMILFIPFAVFADEENNETESNDSKNEVVIYFFRGQGCSHCAEAEEWFKSIEEELGNKFQIVDYETWYNEDNSELMKKVAKARGEEEQATGVPYIIIGDKSWIGFADDYKEEIKEQINSEYDKEVNNRYDIMKLLDDTKEKEKEESNGSDIAALIIILAIVGAIGFGIYKARQTTN